MMVQARRVVNAVRWTAAGQGGRAAIGFLQLLVLSRYLEPADFGTMAIIAAVLALVQILGDSGLGNALIQNRRLTEDALATVYWTNLAITVLLATSLAVSAPLFSSYYENPELPYAMRGCAVAFVLQAASQQFRVLAEKRLDFRPLAFIELSAVGTGFLIAWLSAHRGAGVYSLVAGQIASGLIALALSWILLGEAWRPAFRFRPAEFFRLVPFGLYSVGGQLANAINTQADVVFGGRTLGADALGQYGVARDLGTRIGLLLNPIATRVSMPVMASLQSDNGAMRRVFLKAELMVCSINSPIYLCMAALAPEVVAFAFDPRWAEAGTLLQILALVGLLRSAFNPLGSLIFAAGRPEIGFRWNVALMAVFPLGALVGSQFGAVGLAAATLAMYLALVIPSWYFIVRPICAATLQEYIAAQVRPLTIAGASVSLAWAMSMQFDNPASRLIAGIPAACVLYAGVSRHFNPSFFHTMLELAGVPRPQPQDERGGR